MASRELPFCACQLAGFGRDVRSNPNFQAKGGKKYREAVLAAWPYVVAMAVDNGMFPLDPVTGRVQIPEIPREPVLLGSSQKVEKGVKKKVATTILYMSPSTEAGGKVNMCPFATKECSDACLGHSSGQLSMSTSHNARLWKTALFLYARQEFVALLKSEISVFAKLAKKRGLKPAVRINGSTDVVLPELIAGSFPDVQFYDYTKNPHRMNKFLDGGMPRNYHLTFSFSGHNREDSINFLSRGGNVAVVFDARPAVKGKNKADPLPKTWHGYKVIDADDTDIRFFDPPGTVAGLRFKTAKKRAEALAKAGLFVEPIHAEPVRASRGRQLSSFGANPDDSLLRIGRGEIGPSEFRKLERAGGMRDHRAVLSAIPFSELHAKDHLPPTKYRLGVATGLTGDRFARALSELILAGFVERFRSPGKHFRYRLTPEGRAALGEADNPGLMILGNPHEDYDPFERAEWLRHPAHPRHRAGNPDSRRRQLERDSEAGVPGAQRVLAAVKKRRGELVGAVVSIDSSRSPMSAQVSVATSDRPSKELALKIIKNGFYGRGAHAGEVYSVTFENGRTWSWVVRTSGRKKRLVHVRAS